MQHSRNVRFKDIAPSLLPWIAPDMRHTKHEAMLIYETLSYTLATLSLLQRQHFILVRFRNVTISCKAARSSTFRSELSYELG